MTATLIFIGVATAIVVVIALITVPVTHVEGVSSSFYWRRIVHIGRRVWIQKKSKRKPGSSADIRNVEVRNADDPDNLHYTYEKRVWRNMRTVPVTGRKQETVRNPAYTLGRDEQVRRKTESYEAAFVSEEGARYSAKVRFAQWKSLNEGATYRLGRNVFGKVRTVSPAKRAVNQSP